MLRKAGGGLFAVALAVGACRVLRRLSRLEANCRQAVSPQEAAGSAAGDEAAPVARVVSVQVLDGGEPARVE